MHFVHEDFCRTPEDNSCTNLGFWHCLELGQGIWSLPLMLAGQGRLAVDFHKMKNEMTLNVI